jgi:P-type conjugative transfer protein TrbL
MSPTFFSQVIAPFVAHANAWTAPILSLGTPIFWMLATLELCIVFALMVVNHDIPGMVDDLMRSVIGIGIGYTIFENAAGWGFALVRTITGIGSQVSGFASTLTPDGIMAYGYTMASTLWASVSLGTFLLQPPTTIICLIVGCIVFVLFVWIAITLLLLIIEVYFAVIGGSIFLPFGAFRFTQQLVAAWVNWIMAVSMQTFAMYLILSIAQPLIAGWVAAMGGSISGPPGSFISPIPYTSNFLNPFLVLAQTFIFWALAVKLPLIMRHKVDGIISPFVGLSGVVRSALASANAGADALGTPPAVSGALESGVDAMGATLKAMLLAT